MALSLTEATALAGFGINEALLKGQGVGAKTIKALGKAAVRLSPYAAPVARGTVRTGAALARRNPAAAAGLAGYGAYRAGAFDPVGEAIQMEVDRRVEQIQRDAANPIYGTLEDVVTKAVPKVAKRRVSKYSKAIKAGMAAVKASKFNGKKGKISNAKTTFAKVNKVASAVNKGKKVSAKGVSGVIKRAVGRFL
jgi:hypothetical protein